MTAQAMLLRRDKSVSPLPSRSALVLKGNSTLILPSQPVIFSTCQVYRLQGKPAEALAVYEVQNAYAHKSLCSPAGCLFKFFPRPKGLDE